MSLTIGGVYQHPDQGPIYITSGQYWGTPGLSNFWYWKQINTSGELGKKEYFGYGGDWPELGAKSNVVVKIKEVV